MDLLYFLDQMVFRRITESSFSLKHSHQEVSPQCTLTTYLWSFDTNQGGTLRRAVLTSLQGLVVQQLKVLPVGNLKPPAPLGAA